jgi:hypothetical protein
MLLGQTDVRVAPGSIEPRTKAAMEQRILAFADRGWITSEQAMAAIEGGYTGDLITSYELDVGRITRIITRIKGGQEALFGTPENPMPQRVDMQPDPMTGEPMEVEVPDFMPRQFDNIKVQRSVFEDWMKTEEFESCEPEVQRIATDVYTAMLQIQAQQDAERQMAVDAAAMERGQQNAARPGDAKATPDAAASGDGAMQTPNQPGNQSAPNQQ